MLCRYPMGPGILEYGCGRCRPCRINRRRVWTARIFLESCLHPASFFVTLTYNRENYPKNGSLSKEDFKNFLKRIRKNIFPRKLRYFGVGEYGEKEGRPHYHFILLGDIFPQDIEKAWAKGFTLVGDCSIRSIEYVVSYVLKVWRDDMEELVGDVAEAEFASMSLKPGIGAGAGAEIARAFKGKEDAPTVIRIGGKKYPLGRYMRRKIRVMMGLPENTPPKVIRKRLYELDFRINSMGRNKWKEMRIHHHNISQTKNRLRRERKGSQ